MYTTCNPFRSFLCNMKFLCHMYNYHFTLSAINSNPFNPLNIFYEYILAEKYLHKIHQECISQYTFHCMLPYFKAIETIKASINRNIVCVSLYKVIISGEYASNVFFLTTMIKNYPRFTIYRRRRLLK